MWFESHFESFARKVNLLQVQVMFLNNKGQFLGSSLKCYHHNSYQLFFSCLFRGNKFVFSLPMATGFPKAKQLPTKEQALFPMATEWSGRVPTRDSSPALFSFGEINHLGLSPPCRNMTAPLK